MGNQQFTSRNITIRDASISAIYLNWDWVFSLIYFINLLSILTIFTIIVLLKVWTFKGLNIQNTPVGIDVASGIGSVLVIDSTFSSTGIAVRTQFASKSGEGSVVLDNVQYQSSSSNGKYKEYKYKI